ncbi:MAG: hypothetical protein UR12_C0003G0020 [candidate division TM6 bacterium GW2011_GWF2_30_66]|jgi:hypothetical protein|nr:MAG: hypothetical protein UR12_C0003G0020 [candidate division TM6 bacterium GW2011_GWF2_30_66]
MNKNIFNFLFALLILTVSGNFLNALNWDIYSIDKNIFVGNIIFPKNIKDLPQISLYRRGIKIKTENETSNKKIQFTLSEDKSYKKFYLLITKSITPDIDDNTVKCLKIDPKQAYKFYELTIYTNQELTINPINNLKEIKDVYSWNIQNMKLNSYGIIPDDTLIMIFNPDYIESIEPGTSLELPKIIIKKNILQLAGSEKKLSDETNELLLSCLDLNIIHTNPASEVKPEYKKKLIVAMAHPD